MSLRDLITKTWLSGNRLFTQTHDQPKRAVLIFLKTYSHHMQCRGFWQAIQKFKLVARKRALDVSRAHQRRFYINFAGSIYNMFVTAMFVAMVVPAHYLANLSLKVFAWHQWRHPATWDSPEFFQLFLTIFSAVFFSILTFIPELHEKNLQILSFQFGMQFPFILTSYATEHDAL